MRAVEKYLLGELAGDLREAFEEHYFGCAVCAMELKSGAAFVHAGKEIAREGAGSAGRQRLTADSHGGWLAWLKPAIVIPAFAATLLVIAFQNAVEIPQLKQAVSHKAAPAALRQIPLFSQASRGGGKHRIAVAADESYLLSFDIPPDPPFPGYRCEVRNSGGQAVFAVPVTAAMARNSVSLQIPRGSLPAGDYTIVVRGESRNAADLGAVVTTLSFALEIAR